MSQPTAASVPTPEARLLEFYQQFFVNNEPLFAALAGVSDDPYKMLGTGGLADAAAVARQIALAAARRAKQAMPGGGEPSLADVRPFRIAAAGLVAAAWREGKLNRLQVERIGAELASVLSMVDLDLDRTSRRVLPSAVAGMVGMTVALRLSEPVAVYDFRRNPGELIATMSTAVLEMVAEAADGLVPAAAPAEERRVLIETLAGCLAGIMARVYERKASQHVAHALALSEPERESFARRYDPMPEILRSFRENARVYAGAALAAARKAGELLPR